MYTTFISIFETFETQLANSILTLDKTYKSQRSITETKLNFQKYNAIRIREDRLRCEIILEARQLSVDLSSNAYRSPSRPLGRNAN